MHTRKKEVALGKNPFWSELRVVWAIAMKNLKVSVRYRADYILGTLIPLTLIVTFVLRIFESLTFGPTEGLQEYIGILDYASFAILSHMLWTYYVTVITGGRTNMRNEQLMGTLELAYTCPVKRPILLVGFCLSNFITFVPASIAAFASFFLMGGQFNTTPLNISLALVAFILGIGGCFGLGFVLAGFVVKYREPGILDAVIMQPLYYLSGIAYTAAALPAIARFAAYFNPTSYSIDSVRSLLLGTNPFLPMLYELLALVAFTVVLSLLGILIFNKLEKDVMKKEGIGSY